MYDITSYEIVSWADCRAQTAEDPAVPEVHPVLPGAAPPHNHRPRSSPSALNTQLQGRKDRVVELLSLVQISPDTLLSLVEPYYAGTKVYAITHINTPQGMQNAPIVCYGMISCFHARKGL